MPITPENYRRAEEVLARAKSNPNENPAKIQQLQMQLNSFYEGHQEPGYQSYQPPSDSVSPLRQPSDDVIGQPTNQESKFWYEPTADDVKQSLSSDPELSRRLNLGSWTSSPDQLESITDKSTAFKAVADDKFKRDQETAKAKGVGLERYSDVSFVKNPFDYISGGIGKYGPDAVHGVAAALGMPSSQRMDSQLNEINQELGLEDPESPIPGTSGTVEHPSVKGAFQFAGSLAPQSIGNLAASGISKGLGYTSRGVLGKAGVSGLAGAGAANVEGVVEDVNSGTDTGKTWEDVAKQSLEAAPLRTGIGAIAGSGFDLLGQGAGGVSKAATQSDHDLKLLREAGGDTHVVTGVRAPESIRSNIKAYQAGRTGEVGHPEDIAANKVAPQIEESLTNKAREEHARIAKETEEYISHPEIAGQRESMKGVAQNVINMFKKGAFEGPITGDLMHSNPEAVNTFKKVLSSIGEVKHVSPEESMMFARQSDGIILDGQHLRGIGVDSQPGKVAVYVPAKTDARALLDLEEMIDEKLKMAGTPGGINNPIWKRINESVKTTRDRFGAPVDAPNNLGPTFAPATDLPVQPKVGINQRPIDINQPPQPEAVPGVGPFIPRQGFMEPANPFQPYQPYQPPIDVQAQNPVGIDLPKPPVDQIGLQPGVRFDVPGQPRGIDAITPQRPVVVGNQPARQAVQPEIQPQPVTSFQPEPVPPVQPPIESSVGLGDTEFNPGSLPPPAMSFAPPIQATRREPTASQYVEGNFGQGPNERFSDLDPEVNQSLSELKYQENIDAQKRESDRVAKLMQEMGVQPSDPITTNSTSPEAYAQTIPPKEPTGVTKFNNKESSTVDLRESDIIPEPSAPPEKAPELDMGRRSAQAAYEPEKMVPNDGKFDLSKIKDQVVESGGVDSAGRLNKGMRAESLKREQAKYEGKSPNEVAASLEFPIDVQVDGGNLMLRDGRHRLEAAKKAGATVINTRLRVIDESGNAVEVGVLPLPIYPGEIPKKIQAEARANPKKYTETLDDGTVVHGLSALRRQQHLAQQKLDELTNKTGANRGTTAQKVLGFGSGPGRADTDAALLEEARALGLEKELRETAGTAAYQRLRQRSIGQAGRGYFRSAADVLGMRADPILRSMAGQASNPFTPNPLSPAGRIQQYLFEQTPANALNLTRGLPAARSAPAVEEYVNEQDKDRQ